ncbi:peptidase domain-containing ABC transporter [Janthinobacterium fluminis]|uniref:Peptidase domain-containing ABC transporter n=1 Tax=Janthinobacterium fluminis TaxID=2987524 RepID=A0ABT5K6M1_9BURK|nr:peptidase domain-containing ABC transporter [Janthinobacterium fluminis]MDC8760638.1 peptidase domain-containing ABC transporter [Janthinobacterium fluminis]
MNSKFFEGINFGFSKNVPVVLQTELTECGLSCVAMISGYYGANENLTDLRRKFPLSLKGMTLRQIIEVCGRLHMSNRAVRVEVEELRELKLPCILHWEFNHFVVLKAVGRKTVTIVDPGHGERKVAVSELSNSFTGVALEVWPDIEFKKTPPEAPIKIRELTGKFHGVNGTFAQIIGLALSLEVFALLSPLFMQWVLDNVIVANDKNLLNTLAIGFIFLILLQQGIGAFRSWIMMYFGTSMSVQWRSNVFRHLMSLPISYFERRQLGDVVSRFGSVDSILQTVTSSFLGGVIDGVMTFITLIMMFLYSVELGLISVSTMLLYGLGRLLWYRPLRESTSETIVRGAKTQSHFLESIRGIKALQLFGKQNIRVSAWQSLVVDQVNAGLKTQKLQLLYQQWNGLLFSLEGIVIIWVGANMVMESALTVGMLMAFNSYRSRFDGRVGSLIDNYFSMKMLRVQAERLGDIIQTSPDENIVLDERELEKLDGSLELKGLTFRYAQGEAAIIKRISCAIQPGECVAIVGKTGSGKTTLLNLILGSLKPTHGEILLGNKDLGMNGPNLVRGVTGTVMQDDVLFAGSLADNITFWDNEIDQDHLDYCINMAMLKDDIGKFQMGLNTLVGDMGSALSAGQKQRVLLARALYKKPKILILDEATSNLDVNTEAAINAGLRTLKLTRIVVAHRLSSIEAADRVLYIEDGCLLLDTTPKLFFETGIYRSGSSPSGEAGQIFA